MKWQKYSRYFINFLDTPAVQNKRVEQLRAGSSKSNPNSNRSSPTSNNEPSSPIIPTFNREVLNELDTPTRESILQRWKELDEQTPETKRRRYEAAGIKTPEIATTPYWMEYKWQQCEERRTRHAPTQEQIDKIKNRTVIIHKISEFDMKYYVKIIRIRRIKILFIIFSSLGLK